MNLVSFSIKTKGMHNFTRRLTTVFSRFGFSERRTRRALYSVIESLEPYNAMPTFFIPAVVLERHARLLAEIAEHRAEVGIHGYVHNDYRTLSHREQYKQTEKAISVFEEKHIPYRGFRNPYLGWTEASLDVFGKLGFTYDSNDAVIHDVIDLDQLSPLLLSGYVKSLALFQAIECTSYALRPYFAGEIVRIPTSIPDDEMLFDRLRFPEKEIGRIWSSIMQRVYELGGIYVLNLHPERAILCKHSLNDLLSFTRDQSLPIWVTSLVDVAQWWKERSQFRLNFEPLAPHRWQVEAICTSRSTLLARHVVIEDQPTATWHGVDFQVLSQRFIVNAPQCPCLGISLQTSRDVENFLLEQGYPFVRCSDQDAQTYTYFLDRPEGLGTTREEQLQRKSALLEELEELETPLMYFGCWPKGYRAALSITGDIDSITIQDFFRRIVEV
ncbi:MAG: polysaccharide deacetylase family protein [Ktedonobacteraceae bacterium]